jgi:predicted AlkP superfamily phosphohydrolase/phosphomutase
VAPSTTDAKAADMQVEDTGLRVLLVGLDGGTWEIIDPLMEAGRLPTFSRLVAEGVTAELSVITPTYSPLLWTSIASGQAPNKHGIYSHVRTDLPLGLPTLPDTATHVQSLTKAVRVSFKFLDSLAPFRLVHSTTDDVLTRRLWEILDDAGYPTIVLGWYLTYPARSDLGLIVSDRMFNMGTRTATLPHLVSPASLGNIFDPLLIPRKELPEDIVFSLLDAEDLDAVGRADLKSLKPELFRVLEVGLTRDVNTSAVVRTAFPLLPSWRFAAVYLRAMDNFHHMTWHLKDLPGDELATHPERRFRTAIDRSYEYFDGVLAEILENSDEDTVIIVVSDHGYENERYGHSRAPDGFFIMSGGPTLRSYPRQRIDLYDITPTVLALLGMPVAEDMDGRVVRELVDAAFWEKHPIREVATYGTGELSRDTPETEMSEEIIEQLKALGYI